MKRIFILLLFIFLCLPVFAEYKPIPKELSKQYKAEMESIIDKGYPKAIEDINEYTKEAFQYYNQILLNGYDLQSHTNIIGLCEIALPAAEIDLYADMVKITQEKYLNMRYEPFGTDSTYPLSVYLYPYFQDNHVNTKQLTDIAKYENKKIEIVEGYLDKIQKLVPNTND